MNEYESQELWRATKYLGAVALRGSSVLFVATGQPTCDVIKREASRCHMPFVSERWVGGTLTNFGMTRGLLYHWSKWRQSLEQSVEIARVRGKKTRSDRRFLRMHRMMQRLAGLREMERLPECLVVVDPIKEEGAVGEARKLSIKTIGLVEVSGAPGNVDLAIPTDCGDVDSVGFIVSRLADAILEGGWRA